MVHLDPGYVAVRFHVDEDHDEIWTVSRFDTVTQAFVIVDWTGWTGFEIDVKESWEDTTAIFQMVPTIFGDPTVGQLRVEASKAKTGLLQALGTPGNAAADGPFGCLDCFAVDPFGKRRLFGQGDWTSRLTHTRD